MEGKLVWVRLYNDKKLPIVLTEDMNLQNLEKTILAQIYNNCILPQDVMYFAKRVKILDTKSKAPGTTYLTQKNFWRILEDGGTVDIRMTSEGDLCCCFCGAKDKF